MKNRSNNSYNSKSIHSNKENCGNALIKLFKTSEEVVTKVKIFDPLDLEMENPYNLRKIQIHEKYREKDSNQLSEFFYLIIR